jgi:signal peptidase I
MGINGEGSVWPGWLSRVLIGRNPKFTLVRLLIWVAVLVLMSQFVLMPIRVEGISMLPTLKESGIKFVNCLAYTFHPPQRGDVVAIKFSGKHLMLCKRIVGLPGETLAFHDGHVFINGHVLEEPYVKAPCNWEHEPEQVGPEEYYVVGDNRSMEYEDHTQGRAERKRIVGKLML